MGITPSVPPESVPARVRHDRYDLHTAMEQRLSSRVHEGVRDQTRGTIAAQVELRNCGYISWVASRLSLFFCPVMHYVAASSSLMVLPAGSCMARSPSKLWSRQIAGRRRRLSSCYLTREPGFPL
jgi:hypothetical protein